MFYDSALVSLSQIRRFLHLFRQSRIHSMKMMIESSHILEEDKVDEGTSHGYQPV
jgi:hypothetical protein